MSPDTDPRAQARTDLEEAFQSLLFQARRGEKLAAQHAELRDYIVDLLLATANYGKAVANTILALDKTKSP